MTDPIFPKGIIFKKPKEGAPEWIRGHLSFKVDEAVEFLNEHKKADGWVNIDIKKSKEGKLYLQVDKWEPEGSTPYTPPVVEDSPF